MVLDFQEPHIGCQPVLEEQTMAKYEKEVEELERFLAQYEEYCEDVERPRKTAPGLGDAEKNRRGAKRLLTEALPKIERLV